jgi:2,5-diketo-D-gluconate reductase A
MTPAPLIELNDGVKIPQLGLGVFELSDEETRVSCQAALEAGYRHIDTAAIYRNEQAVGRAVAESGLPRSEVFITTKLWNDDQGFDSALRAFDASLSRLGTDYVDLYLIHWPAPRQDRYVESWRALVRLREEGRVRSIGVSNFQPAHLERVIEATGVVPSVNQVELHPDFAQPGLAAFNRGKGIVIESWSPLGRGGALLQDPTLERLAAKHGKTTPQVILRWHLQCGFVVIPRSRSPERIRQNIDVFDFALDAEDMQAIASMTAGQRIGPDPDTLG